jgi:hypothetical protein
MKHHLAGFFSAVREAHSVHNCVQASFQSPQKLVASCSTLSRSDTKVTPKLPFQQAVDPFQLLLFAKLQTII